MEINILPQFQQKYNALTLQLDYGLSEYGVA